MRMTQAGNSNLRGQRGESWGFERRAIDTGCEQSIQDFQSRRSLRTIRVSQVHTNYEKNNKQGKKAIKFSFYCLFIFIFLLGKKWIILQFLFTLFSKDVEKTETCACKRSHHVLRCLILLKRWKTNYALLWLLLLNKICLRHIDVGEHDQIKHLFNLSSKVTGLFIY